MPEAYFRSSESPPPSGSKVAAVLVATVILLNGIVFTLGLRSLEKARRQEVRQAEVQTQNLAQAISRSLSSRIERIDQALRTIANELETERPAVALDSPFMARFLAVQQDLLLESDALRISDAGGRLRLGRGVDPKKPVGIADRDYFIQHRDHPEGGLFMSKPMYGRVTNGWVIIFSRRYNRPDGSFAGIILASVALDSLHTLLSSFDLGPSGSIALRSSQLEFIVRQPQVLRGQTLEIGDTNVSREVRDLVRSGQASSTYHATTPFDQVRRVFTFSRLPQAPLIVLVGLAEEDYLAQWKRAKAMATALLILFMAVTVVASLFLWSSWRRQQAALEALSAAEARTRLFATVFQQSGEAFVVTDQDNRIVEVNDAFTRLSGYTLPEVLGQNPRLLSSGRTTPAEYEEIWRAIGERGFWQGELWDRHKDGHIYPKWITISAVRSPVGQITHHIATFTDITELKAAEDHIRFLAHHDTLTHLPNRLNLQVRLDQSLALAHRDGQPVAVLFIDLDNFKHINDSLGHKAGDSLLVEVAQRLRGSVRESDVVARLGGDEFVVVLEKVDGAGAALVADKIMKALTAPCRVEAHNLHTTPSIGISLFPDDGLAVDMLMKNADTAMYHAKAAGKNCYHFFTAAMNLAATERLALENDLRQALEEGQFCLHYQPQIEVASGHVVAVEALVRWLHPERGMIPPDRFIGLAEETGLIVPLGYWVLDEALRQLAAFAAAGLTSLRVAVNLSAHQLRDKDLLDQIAGALARHQVAPSCLELEITESVAMENPERTADCLGQLRAQGIGLAIDDFGTGYSSLAYLKQLPIHRLKIDRSFVKDIEHDGNDAAICAATISLSHSLGLEVVGEGVETAAQRDYLAQLGCDLVQGYHYSRPLPPGECLAYVQARAPASV